VSRKRPGPLILLAVTAVVVESVAAAGWVSWRQLVHRLRTEPAKGAVELVGSRALRLPPVAKLARRLPAAELSRASDDLVMSALETVSRDQIRWAPADPSGYRNRAKVALIEGSYATASQWLDEAILRDPTAPDSYRLAALAARSMGETDKALDYLATAQGLGVASTSTGIELTPEETDWVRLEGLERRMDFYPRTRSGNVIALARELRDRDMSEAGRARLEGDAADPRVALEIARWDLLEGRTGDADARLQALVARRGLTRALLAEAWTITAMLRDRQGDVPGAVSAADTAMSYDPRSAGPYRVLSTLAERRGDTAEALEHLRRAWGMNPTDVGLLLNVARVAEKAGRYDDAELALNRAVTVDPSDPGLRARLVEYRLRRGEFMQATLALSEALDRFPTNPRLLRLADRLRAEISRR
jgi:tetratricopeptide (TPR) repeat protein